jgi:hypothetical protein
MVSPEFRLTLAGSAVFGFALRGELRESAAEFETSRGKSDERALRVAASGDPAGPREDDRAS